MLLRDQCISVTDLRTKTKECLEHLDEGEKYIFVNNKPKAVIIDVAVYEKLVMPQLLEIPKNEVTNELKKKIGKSKKKSKSEFINI